MGCATVLAPPVAAVDAGKGGWGEEDMVSDDNNVAPGERADGSCERVMGEVIGEDGEGATGMRGGSAGKTEGSGNGSDESRRGVLASTG